MTDLLALGQALEAIAGCSNDRDVWDRYGWVYATDGDERDARFWLSDHDAEHDDPSVEAFAAEHALSTYLEAATFADVLDVQKRQRAAAIAGDFRAAGITLEMRGYRVFPWMEAPALG